MNCQFLERRTPLHIFTAEGKNQHQCRRGDGSDKLTEESHAVQVRPLEVVNPNDQPPPVCHASKYFANRLESTPPYKLLIGLGVRVKRNVLQSIQLPKRREK